MLAERILERLEQKGKHNWDSSNRASYMWAMRIVGKKNSPVFEEKTPIRSNRSAFEPRFEILKDALGMNVPEPIKRPRAEDIVFNVPKKVKANTSVPEYSAFKEALCTNDEDIVPPAPSFGTFKESREIKRERETIHRRPIADRVDTKNTIIPSNINARDLASAHRVIERLLKIGERNWDASNRDSFEWASKVISRNSITSEREPVKRRISQGASSSSSRWATTNTVASACKSPGSLKEVRGRAREPMQKPILRYDGSRNRALGPALTRASEQLKESKAKCDVSRRVDANRAAPVSAPRTVSAPARAVPLAKNDASTFSIRKLSAAQRIINRLKHEDRQNWDNANKDSFEWATKTIAEYEETQSLNSTVGNGDSGTVATTSCSSSMKETLSATKEPIKRSNSQCDIHMIGKKIKTEIVTESNVPNDSTKPGNLKSAHRLLELLKKKGERNWSEANRAAFEKATKVINSHENKDIASNVSEAITANVLSPVPSSGIATAAEKEATNGISAQCDTSNISYEADVNLTTSSSCNTDLSGPIMMAIIDRSDIGWSISYTNWKLLESQLMNSLISYCKSNPGFPPTFKENGWHYGCVKVITCNDQNSVDFLKTAVSNIGEPWPGAKLTVVPRSSVPNKPRARILVPLEPSDPEAIMYMIRTQNRNLPARTWRMTKFEKVRTEKRPVSIVLTNHSLTKLNENGWKINYGFSSIPIFLYKEYETTDAPNPISPPLGGKNQKVLGLAEIANNGTDVPFILQPNLRKESEKRLDLNDAEQHVNDADVPSILEQNLRARSEEPSRSSASEPISIEKSQQCTSEEVINGESEQTPSRLENESTTVICGKADVPSTSESTLAEGTHKPSDFEEANIQFLPTLGDETETHLDFDEVNSTSDLTLPEGEGGRSSTSEEANNAMEVGETEVPLKLNGVNDKPSESGEPNDTDQDDEAGEENDKPKSIVECEEIAAEPSMEIESDKPSELENTDRDDETREENGKSKSIVECEEIAAEPSMEIETEKPSELEEPSLECEGTDVSSTLNEESKKSSGLDVTDVTNVLESSDMVLPPLTVLGEKADETKIDSSETGCSSNSAETV